MKFIFNKSYLILCCLLFITEVGIALYVTDDWFRPFFGDFLVVILLYCFFKSFIRVSANTCLSYVLMISFLIETLQYFNFVKLIGLTHIPLANVVLGNSFSWMDLLMYTLGVAFVYVIESWRADSKIFSLRSKEARL